VTFDAGLDEFHYRTVKLDEDGNILWQVDYPGATDDDDSLNDDANDDINNDTDDDSDDDDGSDICGCS